VSPPVQQRRQAGTHLLHRKGKALKDLTVAQLLRQHHLSSDVAFSPTPPARSRHLLYTCPTNRLLSLSPRTGSSNYDVWTIQLRALVGVDACKVIDGGPREGGSFDPTLWDRLNEFIISTIVIPPSSSKHHPPSPTSSANPARRRQHSGSSPTRAASTRFIDRPWRTRRPEISLI
jgi:hypothetical protein